jgi:hypothetical protein
MALRWSISWWLRSWQGDGARAARRTPMGADSGWCIGDGGGAAARPARGAQRPERVAGSADVAGVEDG